MTPLDLKMSQCHCPLQLSELTGLKVFEPSFKASFWQRKQVQQKEAMALCVAREGVGDS